MSTQIEDLYSRKSPVEHVLLRPGMYVGSTTARPDPNQFMPAKGKDGRLSMRLAPRTIKNTPACVKIFDEVREGSVTPKFKPGHKIKYLTLPFPSPFPPLSLASPSPSHHHF
jgi:DNA topoisomerase-2